MNAMRLVSLFVLNQYGRLASRKLEHRERHGFCRNQARALGRCLTFRERPWTAGWRYLGASVRASEAIIGASSEQTRLPNDFRDARTGVPPHSRSINNLKLERRQRKTAVRAAANPNETELSGDWIKDALRTESPPRRGSAGEDAGARAHPRQPARPGPRGRLGPPAEQSRGATRASTKFRPPAAES